MNRRIENILRRMKPDSQALSRLRNIFALVSVALLLLALATWQWLHLSARPVAQTPTNTPDVPLPTPNPEFLTATPLADTATLEAAPVRIIGLPAPAGLNTGSPTPYPVLVNSRNETIPVTWGDYPGPTTWPSLPIPPPLGIIPKPDGQINILLLGNDYRRKLGARTDTILLLTLNPETGTATVTSFPRDLYVYAPGYTMMKINSIQPTGGYELLKTTFEYNFGVRPDYYVNISMDAFVQVIDTLGGIRVYVATPIYDPDFADGKYSYGTGWHHMDGNAARWYARSRSTSSDFARGERQQAVLEAIFRRLLSLDGINRAGELFNLYSRYVYTDIELADILPLAPLATQLADTTRVERLAVKPGMVTVSRLPISGAYILIPDRTKILLLMLEVLDGQ